MLTHYRYHSFRVVLRVFPTSHASTFHSTNMSGTFSPTQGRYFLTSSAPKSGSGGSNSIYFFFFLLSVFVFEFFKKKIRDHFYSFCFLLFFRCAKNYGAQSPDPNLVPRNFSQMSLPLPQVKSMYIVDHVHVHGPDLDTH
jgi:hypothetical protein